MTKRTATPEVMPMQTEHKFLVTWERRFGGHPTELTIRQYESWSEVFLKGGGYSGEWETLMHHVPIDVMREIVRIHDELPNPQSTARVALTGSADPT